MSLLIFLVIIGVVMALLPMDVRVKQLLYVVVVILFILWLVNVLGLSGHLRLG